MWAHMIAILISADIPPSVECQYKSIGDTRIATCIINHDASLQREKLKDSINEYNSDSISDIAFKTYPVEKWFFEDAVSHPGFNQYKILIKEKTIACEDQFGNAIGPTERDVAMLNAHRSLVEFYKKFKRAKFEGYESEYSGRIKLVDLTILTEKDVWPYTYPSKNISFGNAFGAIKYFDGYCGRSWPRFDNN